jgi:hypothetical protein
VSDDIPLAPFAHEGLDSVPEPKSTIAEVSEAVKGTVHRVSGAIEAGRKPGMPLSILTKIAREAPLGSLLVAFLLGVCRRPPPMMVWGRANRPGVNRSADCPADA